MRRAKARRNVILSHDRDLPLLKFLWRWKLGTTAALHELFYPTCSARRAYNRLMDLSHAGLIEARRDQLDEKYLWCLTKNGFEIVKPNLPPLRANGFRSESPAHDLIVTAAHLGCWMTRHPENISLFSEQELRCLSLDMYPSWVPKNSNHRPDGYWRVPGRMGVRTIALEVELSWKGADDLISAQSFYDYHEQVTRVLWIVATAGLGRRIDRNMAPEDREGGSPHNFILLDHLFHSGWEAEAYLGPDQGKTIAEILGESTTDTPVRFPASVFFNTRKCPLVSTPSKHIAIGDFSH